MQFKGCDSSFEANIFLIFNVATGETSTLHEMYMDSAWNL